MRPRRFSEVEAYQHAEDQYFYRPLVAGKELFTYIAHVPSGGTMPPDAEEAEEFELSLFMLQGMLQVTLADDRFALYQGEALHIPRTVPFGVENTTDHTASFLLSFSPPPRVDLDTMRERAEANGRTVLDPEECQRRFGPFAILED